MRRLPVCPGTAALGASGSWGLWEETERDWARGVLLVSGEAVVWGEAWGPRCSGLLTRDQSRSLAAKPGNPETREPNT